MKRILVFCSLLSLFFVAACNRLAVDAARTTNQPVQISAPNVDAAEPSMAAAPDGFYVVWVDHKAEQADVMLARFNNNGAMRGSSVRVNHQPGNATAWRGDQPSIAVAANGSVYVVWTARVQDGDKHGTDLYLPVSNDGGQNFASEVKINDDKVPNAHG